MSDNLKLKTLLDSCVLACKLFCVFFFQDSLGIHQYKFFLPGVLLIVSIILLGVIACVKSKITTLKTVFLIFLLLIFGIPVCTNAIGILSANSTWYYISANSFCITAVLPLVLSDKLIARDCNESNASVDKVTRYSHYCIVAITVFLCVHWIISNNTVYQMIGLINSEYDAKFTALASRIEAIYDDNDVDSSDVVVIGQPPYGFLQSTGTLETYTNEFDTHGYGISNPAGMINSSWVLEKFMRNKYSFDLSLIEDEKFLVDHKDEIEQLEIYPQKGSVTVIDGKRVVKLSNNY